jgi:predicted transcriptional regulator
MATIIFDDLISNETIKTLIEKIETSEDDTIDLYFASAGGDAAIAGVLIHYLSNSIKNINLYAYWQIASAAVDVVMDSVCRKELLPDAWCVIHLYTRDIGTRDMLDKESLDAFLEKRIEEDNAALVDKFRRFLTAKELKCLRKGGDVFLNHERFVDMVEKGAMKMVEQKEEPEKEEGDAT